MANEKNGEKSGAAKTGQNRLGPPPKIFRWNDSDSVSGKLMEPITRSEQKFGPRARVVLDTATVLLPARYADHFSKIPVGAKLTLTRSGSGRDMTYEAAWD